MEIDNRTAGHTPTPWSVSLYDRSPPSINENGHDGATKVPIINWQGFDDSSRCMEGHEASAKLIVLAVNCHADLLAACKAAREWLVNFGHVAEGGDDKPVYEQLNSAINRTTHMETSK